jgi:hypothetical protein
VNFADGIRSRDGQDRHCLNPLAVLFGIVPRFPQAGERSGVAGFQRQIVRLRLLLPFDFSAPKIKS